MCSLFYFYFFFYIFRTVNFSLQPDILCSSRDNPLFSFQIDCFVATPLESYLKHLINIKNPISHTQKINNKISIRKWLLNLLFCVSNENIFIVHSIYPDDRPTFHAHTSNFCFDTHKKSYVRFRV